MDVHDPQEIAAHAGRRRISGTFSGPGEIAAAVFKAFDAGVSKRDIVIQLRETPAKVDELHDQWLDFGGAELVLGQAVRAELARFVGPFSDVAELVARVTSMMAVPIEVDVEEGSSLARASDAQVERAIVAVLDQVEREVAQGTAQGTVQTVAAEAVAAEADATLRSPMPPPMPPPVAAETASEVAP